MRSHIIGLVDLFQLSKRIDLGDILVIEDAGAHGHSMGYNYNGKLRSAELLMHRDHSVTCIRRAQTPADYFGTLDVDPEFEAASESCILK